MDLLTHLFLPVAVACAIRPGYFDRPLAFGLAGFAVLPDADKIVVVPGGLHSLLALLPIAVGVVAVERAATGENRYAPLAVALLYSHLLLDVVDGNLVTLLAPITEVGVGLRYPGSVSLGGEWPIAVRGDLIAVAVRAPDAGAGGPGTYPLVQKYGVLSALVFAAVVAGRTGRRA